MRNAELWDVEDAVPYDQMERVRKSVGAPPCGRPNTPTNDTNYEGTPQLMKGMIYYGKEF